MWLAAFRIGLSLKNCVTQSIGVSLSSGQRPLKNSAEKLSVPEDLPEEKENVVFLTSSSLGS